MYITRGVFDALKRQVQALQQEVERLALLSKGQLVLVSDIQTFFESSTRTENDATNKLRESILQMLTHPPVEYTNHSYYGNQWKIVCDAWASAYTKVAQSANVPPYTRVEYEKKGGRKYNYDGTLTYYNDKAVVAERNIEFKYGGSKIDGIPQFLSLAAKEPFFKETYDAFYYKHYLLQYIACDTGITEPPPTMEEYLKVVKANTSNHPFFKQLREREHYCKELKDSVVNTSITEYLTLHGQSIDAKAFEDRVKATQSDKVFLLWSNGHFTLDKLSYEEMTNIVFHGIRNGNLLELRSGSTVYAMLLRWRNHKGILNPAWQIALRRVPLAAV